MDFAKFREGCRVLSAVPLYGAILSTFNYVQAARKDRRDVVVQATTAIPTYGNTLGNCLAKVEAINAGHRAVAVSTSLSSYQEESGYFRWGPEYPVWTTPVCLPACRTVKQPTRTCRTGTLKMRCSVMVVSKRLG